MALQKGSVLGGRYELIDKLGEGGMGSVWVARNTAIGGAEVAVKVLHPNLADDKSSVARFRNEAAVTARIGHPHIVRVFDFGESDDGAPFMVMERLVGESLAERLEREGTLPPREAAALVSHVLGALAAAHEIEVLHRDLKPENLFLSREGDAVVAKILDFGVSKILGDDARRTRMTRTGAIIGTPAYMSPEQVMGTSVDLRSDVWAMGVILYELITGKIPFDGSNYNAVLVRIATTEPDPVTTHVPDLDPGLAAIIGRAMARKATARFASALHMREALERWLRGEAVGFDVPAKRAPTDPSKVTPMAFEQGDTLPGDTLSPKLRSPKRMVVGGIVATLALAAVMVAWNPFAHRVQGAVGAAPAVTALSARPMLRVEALPAGAHIYVDDQPVMLPTVVAAGSDHSVRVSANGYRDWVQMVRRPVGDVSLRYAGEAEVAVVVDAAVAPVVAEPAARRAPSVRTGARARTGVVNGRAGGPPNSLVGGGY